MSKRRALREWWRVKQRVHPQQRGHAAHTLYETAWSAAWPHLDDWFTPKPFYI